MAPNSIIVIVENNDAKCDTKQKSSSCQRKDIYYFTYIVNVEEKIRPEVTEDVKQENRSLRWFELFLVYQYWNSRKSEKIGLNLNIQSRCAVVCPVDR